MMVIFASSCLRTALKMSRGFAATSMLLAFTARRPYPLSFRKRSAFRRNISTWLRCDILEEHVSRAYPLREPVDVEGVFEYGDDVAPLLGQEQHVAHHDGGDIDREDHAFAVDISQI